MRVRDGGGGTPGGLIRRLIEATATARTHLNDDRIWVYHNAGGLRAGIRHPTERIDAWVAQNDIVDDDGKPLHLLLSRLRKRSEEHTSELQSLMRISYAVFCLKNKKHK